MSQVEMLLQQALALHQQGKLDQAEAAYHQILQIAPNYPDAIHLLGVIAAHRGDLLTALKLIRKAIELDPTSAPFHNNLGSCLGSLMKKDEEEQCYRKALELAPNFVDAYNNLVNLLETQGRHEEAERVKQSHNLHANKASLDEYQRGVDELRRTPYLEYPKHVHMETMAKCNAACVFCPYPSLERKGSMMPDDLVHKIINDLTDIPRHIPFQLSPFKVNEPFLDVRLFDILQLINEKLPNSHLTMTTNASPITEKNLTALGKVKNLNSLWISFNDHREKEYEDTMKLPYKRTIERLDMIHQKRASGEFPFQVYLSRVGDATPADMEFINWVRAKYPYFETCVMRRGSWIGQVDIDQDVPDIGCSRWFELSITATGSVAHCCMDGQNKWPIGDVTKQHVLEVYNDPHYRVLRERTRSRRDATPCNQCAFM